MRKIMMTLALLLTCAGAKAQKHDFGTYAAGVKGSYSLDSNYKNAGVGLFVQGFWLFDNFRPTVGFNHFFKKENVSSWEGNVDFQYVIPIGRKTAVYPFVGPSFATFKLHGVNKVPEGVIIDLGDDYGDDSETRFGFNVGCGIEHYVTPSFKVFGEAKYQYMKDYDRPVVSAGVAVVW